MCFPALEAGYTVRVFAPNSDCFKVLLMAVVIGQRTITLVLVLQHSIEKHSKFAIETSYLLVILMTFCVIV